MFLVKVQNSPVGGQGNIYGRGDSDGECDGGANSEPPTHEKEERERKDMASHDLNTLTCRVGRPRESLELQMNPGLTVNKFLGQMAEDRKVKRAGYTMYRQCDLEEVLQETGNYYLTWQKAARGGAKGVGSPSEVSTTLSFHSGRTDTQSGPEPGMKEARQALERLDDLIQRIRLAQEYLRMFDRASEVRRSVRVIHLDNFSSGMNSGTGDLLMEEPRRRSSKASQLSGRALSTRED